MSYTHFEWYDVTGIYAGALDEQRHCQDEQAKDEAVQEIKKLYEQEPQDEQWQIHVVPHTCDPDDEDSDCSCPQYMTDHRPVHQSKELA